MTSASNQKGRPINCFVVEYIYGFVGWGSAGKVDDVIPSRAVQDGGYALPWQRYDNNKMSAICYYGNVMATTKWRLCVTMETLSQHLDDVSSVMHAGCLHADRTIFYIFNSTVIDWTFFQSREQVVVVRTVQTTAVLWVPATYSDLRTRILQRNLLPTSYLLTPWSRVFLEKLTGSAASQEIGRIFGTPRFITLLKSACHLSLPPTSTGCSLNLKRFNHPQVVVSRLFWNVTIFNYYII